MRLSSTDLPKKNFQLTRQVSKVGEHGSVEQGEIPTLELRKRLICCRIQEQDSMPVRVARQDGAAESQLGFRKIYRLW